MAKFSSDYICGCFNSDGIRFKLSCPLSYQTDIKPEDYGYTPELIRKDKNGLMWIDIPTGFVTDFATIPKIGWSIINPIGKHSRAAIVHDFIYVSNKEGRPWADAVFLEAMKISGTNWFTKYVCYWGVRLLGRKAWDSYTSEYDIQDKNWLE